MRFDFIHCHGSGNDFPLIDARDIELDDGQWSAVARALADRRGPVGGDGLLLLTSGDKAHPFGMRMFNPDGSEAEMCLNGLRCVARAGFEAKGLTRAAVKLVTSSVDVAIDTALAPDIYTVRETAGPVDLDAAAWLKDGGHEHVERSIAGLPSGRRFVALSIGNPHLITFVDTVNETELSDLGRWCETAPPLLPRRANVSFVEQPGPDMLFVRTFERGAGLTAACGSAMAASSFAACLTERVAFDAPITVRNAGGLVRAIARADGMVSLSGNATWEWRGSAEVDLARGIAGDVQVVRHYNDEIAAWANVVDQAG